MKLRSIKVRLMRTTGTEGGTVLAGNRQWSGEDLPSRSEFMFAVEAMYDLVEIPSFPTSAWVTVDSPRGMIQGQVVDGIEFPLDVAAKLWAYVVAVGQGLLGRRGAR